MKKRDNLSKEMAEQIFIDLSNFVYRIALFLTRSRELADDITQETFIRVFKKYRLYDPSKPMKPWVYKIAVNTARNMLRKQRWLKFMDEIPETEGFEGVEASVLKTEAERELWRVINELSLKNREVVILHFYSGLKLKEVSDVLGIPIGTCKSRLNSALSFLRQRLPLSEEDFLQQGGELYETRV